MKSNPNPKQGQFARIDTFKLRMPEVGQEGIDALKFELCMAIERVMARQQWTQSEAAFYLATSRANISRVCNKKIERMTLNQLFDYLARACPEFRIMLSMDHSLTGARAERLPP